jgi:hypothetical protein
LLPEAIQIILRHTLACRLQLAGNTALAVNLFHYQSDFITEKLMAKARIIPLLITVLKPRCKIYLQYFIFT